MPDPAPAPSAPPVDDPFDLGDTSLTFPQSVATSTPPELIPPAAKPPQPRAPDGTFARPETQHPSGLVNQAVEFGLEADDISGMTTPALYKLVNRMMAKEREIARSFATAQSLEAARVQQPPPAPPAPPAPDEFEALAAEGLDPRLVKEIKDLRAAKKDLESIKANLQDRESRDQAEKISLGAQLVDAAFAKLNNPLLGSESGAELNAATEPAKQAMFKRRIALLNAIGITDLRQVNRLTIMKQLRDTADLLFGSTPSTPADPYASALNGKPRITQEEWEEGSVARPTNRNGATELKGEALALANLTRKFREQDAMRTDESELDGIPE